MKIATIASGTTSLQNKEVETSIQSLYFDITKTVATQAANPETFDIAQVIITEMIGDCTITLNSQTPEATITLQQKIKLQALAEMSANNGGFIRLDYNPTTHAARLRFTTELSVDGAFKLDDDSKIAIDIEGKSSTSTMVISALDYPIKATKRLRYERKFVNGGVEKDFEVRDSAVMAFPIASLDELKVYYNNGKQVTMGVEEIKQRLLDSEDPIYCFNGRTYYGYGVYVVLNVEAAWKVTALLNADNAIFQIKNEVA